MSNETRFEITPIGQVQVDEVWAFTGCRSWTLTAPPCGDWAVARMPSSCGGQTN